MWLRDTGSCIRSAGRRCDRGTSCSSECADSRAGSEAALPLDDPLADAFELDEPAQLHQLRDAFLVAERGDHPCEIADRRDRGPDAAPEGLAGRATAEIV